VSRGLVQPQFPSAPDEYNKPFMAEVVRSFAVFLQQINNPGPWRATDLVLTNLQTDDQGLELGGLFQQDGYVKVTIPYMPHPRGNVGTGAVGAATVAIS
tara:strand:- start:331 stop:627 length:297 start_codon:yes stop_codon:yes gene_type:complete